MQRRIGLRRQLALGEDALDVALQLRGEAAHLSRVEVAMAAMLQRRYNVVRAVHARAQGRVGGPAGCR